MEKTGRKNQIYSAEFKIDFIMDLNCNIKYDRLKNKIRGVVIEDLAWQIVHR